LKALAARRHTTLKQLLLTAAERELSRETEANAQRPQSPLVRSAKPGSLDITNAKIDDLLA
jgi:hypothetical protein